tara:strand:+ start:5544 stop:6083 length:540 start_codon:yes stop_codon:yes gene_type:complete
MAVFNVISHDELGSSTASWENTSIPSSYDHLMLKVSARSTASGSGSVEMKMQWQGENDAADYAFYRSTFTLTGGSNQAGRAHAGTGDPHYKAGYIPEAGALADSFCNLTVWIPNYSDTTAYKQGFLHNSQQYNSNYLFGNVMTACLFLDDAAIHTIKLFPLSGSFAQYSSFTIYGINGV